MNAIDVAQETVTPDKAAFVSAVHAALAAGLHFNALAVDTSNCGYGGNWFDSASALDDTDRYTLALTAWYRMQRTAWPSHLIDAEAVRWAKGTLRAECAEVRPCPSDIEDLSRTLDLAFPDDEVTLTSKAAMPSELRSAVSALCVQKAYGGTLVRAVVCGVVHTWNVLDDGREVDAARCHVRDWAPGRTWEIRRAELLSDAAVTCRYRDAEELFTSVPG